VLTEGIFRRQKERERERGIETDPERDRDRDGMVDQMKIEKEANGGDLYGASLRDLERRS